MFIISNGWWILLTSNSWLYLPFAYLFMFGMKFSFFLFCMCVYIESGTTIIELPIQWIHSTKRIAGKTLSMMMLLLLLLEIGARVTRDVKQMFFFFFCYTNTIYLCVSFFSSHSDHSGMVDDEDEEVYLFENFISIWMNYELLWLYSYFKLGFEKKRIFPFVVSVMNYSIFSGFSG